MARPNFVWRLRDLADKENLGEAGGWTLKIQRADWRLWVSATSSVSRTAVIRIEEKVNGQWTTVEEYRTE